MKNQILAFLQSNDLICNFQSGFRPGHSPATALLKVTTDINEAIEKKITTVLLMLDFSKAFDSVDHRLLCEKLKTNFGFGSSAMLLIVSYLSERSHSDCIEGAFSMFLPSQEACHKARFLALFYFRFS